jgi:hypothetical protein
MRRLRLAYRDNDRSPVIWAIREQARQYGVDLEILQIKGTHDYEAALPIGACDVIIEHLEYLYGEPLRGRNVSMFCAPQLTSESEMVVAPGIQDPSQLVGRRIAVRTSGRVQAIVLRLRAMGLEDKVELVMTPDAEVGRWCQWKKVESGDCVATFISSLYVKPALQAGLEVMSAASVPVVGHYAQACLTSFGAANDELMRDYMKGVIHALCWLKLRRDEALAFASGEPRQLMGIQDRAEFEWRFDAIVKPLQLKPYPTAQAVINMYEMACAEFPNCEGLNPLTLWDLHWLKQLDDEGFVDRLIAELG